MRQAFRDGSPEQFLAALLALPVFIQTEMEARRPIEPGPRLADAVMAGFRLRRTSLYKWCASSGLRQQNAHQILTGRWTGPTAKRHLEAMVEASGARALLTQSNEEGSKE
jgi:hypothetical protein